MRKAALSALVVACGVLTPFLAHAQTLQEVLAKTYATNPEIQAEQASLRAQDEQVAKALSGWRPSVDAVAGVGRSRQKIHGGSSAGSDTLAPRDVGIQLDQPVFQGFRTVGEVRAAEALVESARAALKAKEQEVLLAAAKAYLDVVRSQKVLELTRHNEEVLSKQQEETRRRLDVGEVTKTDLAQASSRLAAAHATHMRAQGSLGRDRAAFLRLVGSMPESLTPPRLILDAPRSEEETAALAVKANPIVLVAVHGQDAAQADVTTAQSGLLPDVRLTGTLARGWDQTLMQPEKQDEATVMARVTIPLYRGGADYAAVRAARHMVAQSRLTLEAARARSREFAVQAWQNLEAARAAIAAHKSEVKAMALAVAGVREERKAGTRTTLDVLNAEQEWLTAQVNLVGAEHDEALAILQVRSAIGSLTAQALGLSVPLYDPAAHLEDVRGKWVGLGKD